MQDLFIIPSIIIALAALTTSIIALFKVTRDQSIRKIDMYLKFQERYREIQNLFAPGINETDNSGNFVWRPKTVAEKRIIEQYWILVYDEWFFFKRGGKYLHEIWDKKYIFGIRSAFKRQPFTEILEEILNLDSFFLGEIDLFKKEMNRIYRIDHARNLKI